MVNDLAFTFWKEYRQQQRQMSGDVRKIDGLMREALELERRAAKMRDRAMEIKRCLDEQQRVNWIDMVLEPIAKEIADVIDCEYKIVGPSGMYNRTHLYLCSFPEKPMKEQEHMFIILRPELSNDGFNLYYETGEATDDYPKGSIAEVNGMNSILAKLPDDVNDILPLLMEGHWHE